MKQSYQDTWQDGARVAAGERDCEGRYGLIAATLPAAARFTVLDVGAYTGYFATRIVEDFEATATAVDDYDGLAAASSDKVSIVPRRLSAHELRALPRHDVTVALSVLHHMKDWREALPLLLACRSHAVLEICDPRERWMRRAAARRQVAEQHQVVSSLPGAELLGTSPRTGRDGVTYQRPLYRLPGTIRTLTGVAFAGSGWCSRNMPRYDVGLGALLGYEPFPGSLNVRLPEPHALGKPWLDWRPAARHDRQLWRAWVGDLPCHAHVPGTRNHGPDTLELVAPVKLRDRLGIADGDAVTFDVEVGE